LGWDRVPGTAQHHLGNLRLRLGRPWHPDRSPFYAVTQTQQRMWVATDLSALVPGRMEESAASFIRCCVVCFLLIDFCAIIQLTSVCVDAQKPYNCKADKVSYA
jgi:hypothetical protein